MNKDNKCSRCDYMPSKDNWDILAHVISGSGTDQPRVEKVCRACLDEIALYDRTKYPRKDVVDG